MDAPPPQEDCHPFVAVTRLLADAGVAVPEVLASDLERGFIRAEVVPLVTVVDDGGWDESKKAGHIKVEGKDYVVRDGDAILVRFSV